MGRRELRADPVRTCIGCRTRSDVAGLVRLVLLDDVMRPSEQSQGRGAWLCRGNRTCFDTAVRRKAFGRAMHAPVSEQALEALKIELFKDS